MMVYPVGLGSLGTHMKIYSIVRVGDEYVVRAGEKSVLKIASRRRAAQLVTDAVELLDSLSAPLLSPQDPPQDPCEPSTACDPEILPDPSEVP
jgi:hypothetical protein